MNKQAFVWLLCLGSFFLTSCEVVQIARLKKAEPGYVTHRYNSTVTEKTRLYGVYVPQEYNSSPQKWPLILFLHGLGESGDGMSEIDRLLVHGPIKEALIREQHRNDSFPFIIVAPQAPEPADLYAARFAWQEFEPDIIQILNDVKKRYQVDEERIYITGLSMGGFGTFYMVAEHPEIFAAAAPICGGGNPLDAKKYAEVPFWVFHGEKDATVPYKESQQMVDQMEHFTVDVDFTLYPDVGHDSWTQTYQDDDLYAWFLAHKRKSTQ